MSLIKSGPMDLEKFKSGRKIMRFYDTESGKILTENELHSEYLTMLETGEIDEKSFADYVEECTGKNGTLEKI